MNDIQSSQLALDTNLKPTSIKGKPVTQEQYYKATFSPAFPHIENFRPNQFIYQSFTKDTMSIMAGTTSATFFTRSDSFYPTTFKQKFTILKIGAMARLAPMLWQMVKYPPEKMAR
ncbi:hypothetical protein J3Q09_11480 [Pseudomonas sp. R4-83]|uniref:hypothetical protein n=1 Tax=unclassified Pseudomonas TaxID=196821 RepID=UPI003DA80731